VTDCIAPTTGAERATGFSPGDLLRAARERAGWSTEGLAGEMFLSVERLRALESDDHTGFGGPVFVRGHLRRAATILGVSPQEFISAYETGCGTTGPAEAPGLIPGALPRRAGGAWSRSLTGLVLVALAVGSGWWWMGAGGGESLPQVAMPTAWLGFAKPAEPQVLSWEPQPEIPSDAPVTPVSVEAAPSSLPSIEPEAIVLAAGANPLEQEVTQDPEPAAPPPGTVELRFAFSQDCWLEVNDADDSRVAYRLYRSGEIARFRGKAPMTMFLGNADGVELTVDGAPVPLRPASRRDGTARLTVGGGAG
jgi:cytoskeleton protein RodZ